MKCNVCGTTMFGPTYIKEIVTPPEECEDCRKNRANLKKIMYIEVYVCPQCQKLKVNKMTSADIRANVNNFIFGPVRDRGKLKKQLIGGCPCEQN